MRATSLLRLDVSKKNYLYLGRQFTYIRLRVVGYPCPPTLALYTGLRNRSSHIHIAIENHGLRYYFSKGMDFFSNLMPGRGAVDQDIESTPQAGSIEMPRQPEKPPHQAAGLRRSRTTRATETRGPGSLAVGGDRFPECDVHENEGPRVSQQALRYEPGQVMQFDEPARVSELSDRAESGLVRPYGSSRTHDRTSWSAETTSRSEYRGQGLATASTYIDSHDGIPGLREVPDKIDILISRTEKIERGVMAFEQDKNEKLALEKKLQQMRDQLRERTMALEETQKRWKNAVAQLSQFQSQEQRLEEVSDSDLIADAIDLRYNIRSFSMQYFSGQGSKQHFTLPSKSLSKYMRDATGGTDDYINYLVSSTQGPVIIQAFLWRVLVGEIFGHFCWVPRLQASIAMLCRALEPGMC